MKRRTSRKGSITLSPEHGLNPSITHCFICGKEMGIAFLGKLKGDAEAPKDISDPSMICDVCRKQIDAGNKFFIEVKNYSVGNGKSPVRTGRLVCIKGSALPEVKTPINYMEEIMFKNIFSEALEGK